MQKMKRYLLDNSAMTLVEVLVALVILGLIIIAIFPLLTQGLQVTNLANQITNQLFSDQEDIEIVAATNGGVLFADGTFLTDKQFKVLFGSSSPYNEKTVVGFTVKKRDLVRFIASIARVKATYVYEGYNAAEAEIPITGTKTNFIDTSRTVLLVTDRAGNNVTSACGYTVSSQTQAKIVLPTNSDRFTNASSPYTITLTTGNEQVSTLLPVYLPRSIAVQSDGDLIISSNTADWINKDTSSVIDERVNKIVFMATSENDARFVAVGNNGSIYLWTNGQALTKVNHGLTAQELNNIYYSGDKGLLIACGNGGVILTSSNGTNWAKRASGSNENLKAISYQTNSDRFICVGETGGILTSADGISWTQQNCYPRLAANVVNSQNAVEFSGNGDYLKTIQAPVKLDSTRTILMVTSPKRHTSSLISWGSPLGTVAGGRFSFGIDGDSNLRIEQGSGIFYSANLKPALNGELSIQICRSTTSDFNSYHLYQNGTSPYKSDVSSSINTSDYFPAQLGSDPFTRYTSPFNFEGLIAEVLIFDNAVSESRSNLNPADPHKKYASDMDLLRKYLSDKYNLGINSLDGTSTANLVDPESNKALSDVIFDSLPAEVSQDHLVLWLDASNSDSLDLENENQVLFWRDLSSKNNHASGAALNAVACSTDKIIAGGYHRNLLNSTNATTWSQTHQLDSKRTTEYSVDDLVFAEKYFVALINDGLSSFTSSSSSDNRQNALVAYSKDGVDWTLGKISLSNNHINDMFYDAGSRTILVVGDNGDMFASTDNGVNWTGLDSDTIYNLLAVCIR